MQTKEERAKYSKGYREKNKKKASLYSKEYREKHKERIATLKEKYYRENKEKIIARKKKHYKENKERIAVNQAAYYRKQKHEPVVYFLLLDGWIKIGWTSSIGARMRNLTRNTYRHPFRAKGRLELLGSICGCRATEKEEHERFKALRYKDTEWFKKTPELLEYIDRVTINQSKTN